MGEHLEGAALLLEVLGNDRHHSHLPAARPGGDRVVTFP
jgi:hypothetical protein